MFKNFEVYRSDPISTASAVIVAASRREAAFAEAAREVSEAIREGFSFESVEIREVPPDENGEFSVALTYRNFEDSGDTAPTYFSAFEVL